MVFEGYAEGVAILCEYHRTVGMLVEACYLVGRRIMWGIDICHLGEVVVEATEVRAYLRIADGTRRIEFCLHIIS